MKKSDHLRNTKIEAGKSLNNFKSKKIPLRDFKQAGANKLEICNIYTEQPFRKMPFYQSEEITNNKTVIN